MKLKKEDRRVYVIVGDGESQEGQVWEAALCAPKFKLDNLVAFLDNNGYQNDGLVSETMPLEPIKDKWESFGWYVQRVNGHDISSLQNALNSARNQNEKPTLIIADTVKGKGVSVFEGNRSKHNGAISKEDYRVAMQELGAYNV